MNPANTAVEHWVMRIRSQEYADVRAAATLLDTLRSSRQISGKVYLEARQMLESRKRLPREPADA